MHWDRGNNERRGKDERGQREKWKGIEGKMEVGKKERWKGIEGKMEGERRKDGRELRER